MTMSVMLEDELELDDEGTSLADEQADDLLIWRRSAVTGVGRRQYIDERDKAIVELIRVGTTSSDPHISRLAMKVQTLEGVVKYFGGKTKEEELK